MPSLIRFLFVVGSLGALIYGGMWALATYVEPEPREMSWGVKCVMAKANVIPMDEPDMGSAGLPCPIGAGAARRVSDVLLRP